MLVRGLTGAIGGRLPVLCCCADQQQWLAAGAGLLDSAHVHAWWVVQLELHICWVSCEGSRLVMSFKWAGQFMLVRGLTSVVGGRFSNPGLLRCTAAVVGQLVLVRGHCAHVHAYFMHGRVGDGSARLAHLLHQSLMMPTG